MRAHCSCVTSSGCVHELSNLMQQGSCGPVSWGVGAWLGPRPQGLFGLWPRGPGTGVAELSTLGLVHPWCPHPDPCGHRVRNGAAWLADAGVGVGAERETLLHPHPVCQDAYCDGSGGKRGFLPVVSSLPGCKTSTYSTPHSPTILESLPQSHVILHDNICLLLPPPS